MSTRRKFLVVADDTPEYQTALRFACRRAQSTGGYVALLRVIQPAVFEHWSGVREEIARQQRQEAETALQLSAEFVQAETGLPPEFLILEADSTRAALKRVLSEDPDIKILVLAASAGRGGPGPLVSAIGKDGTRFGSRKVPVTIVPGDLTDDEIAALA
ncbi:universal stress protein [Phenylobacterium sp.]|uniref:universal stress protein n=1 Tax=Phenylobacterium sp. TaxID=1871053 RepID=UPI003D28F2E2